MRTITYSVPEILLDSQIQPAIDKLNNIDANIKCYMIHKALKREVIIEFNEIELNEDGLDSSDIFCLGTIFGRSIKL
jgi:hypothetical protein